MTEETKPLGQREKIEAEELEIETLMDRGMSFTVGKKTFVIYQPFYGTLDILANIFIKMDVNIDALEKSGEVEAKRLASQYSKLCAEAIAVSVLRTKWKIRFFRKTLRDYFLWNLTPSIMHELVKKLNVMLNLSDFIHSIILMSASRTTMPDLMEANKKA